MVQILARNTSATTLAIYRSTKRETRTFAKVGDYPNCFPLKHAVAGEFANV